MPRVCISLGSNLGDREEQLRKALESLRCRPEIRNLRVSSFYETDPVGGPPQGKYMNAAAVFETELSAGNLLVLFKATEKEQGRQPGPRFAARPIDLDLLLYGDEILDRPELQIPHPRMLERRFVLDPLAEIAAEIRHPVCGRTIASLREQLLFPKADA